MNKVLVKILCITFSLISGTESVIMVGSIAPNWALKSIKGKIEFLNNYCSEEYMPI